MPLISQPVINPEPFNEKGQAIQDSRWLREKVTFFQRFSHFHCLITYELHLESQCSNYSVLRLSQLLRNENASFRANIKKLLNKSSLRD